MIGRTLSHYKVLEELSRGGMGIVYRALDVKLDREVRLLASLNHPNIATIFDLEESNGVWSESLGDIWVMDVLRECSLVIGRLSGPKGDALAFH